jgi:signal transduction histidine kinase
MLQYRWQSALSNAELEQRRSALKAGATQFGHDFDRELARVYLAFQMDADSIGDQASDEFALHNDEWLSTAPYPRLVGDAYLESDDGDGGLHLARYNRESRRFESIDWPARLSSLRERFQKNHYDYTQTNPKVRKIVELTADEIPALVIPIANTLGKGPLDINVTPPSRYLVVTLNLDYLKEEFIPLLSKRYFSGSHELEYDVAVTNRQTPPQVVYRTNDALALTSPSSIEAEAELFSIHFEDIKDLVLERYSRAPGLAAMGQTPNRTRRLILSLPNQNSAGVTPVGTVAGRWRLLASHRMGSLEAMVANIRRRNLIISFGILVLLGASVVMLLISTGRAQRLAQQQMEFVAGVSHELRSPLASICAAGENLADGVVTTSPQVQKYGALIKGEGHRLTLMVEQVLEFAGIQAGRRPYEFRRVAVADVIERSLVNSRFSLANSSSWIERKIQSQMPDVMADPEALGQAIQNLINNAIKYSGNHSPIKILATTADSQNGLELQITVKDQGSGISPDDLPHIFDPFYRGREARAAQIPGSGLGLSLVKRIIEAHGGSVSVTTSTDRGSSFTLHLPVVR